MILDRIFQMLGRQKQPSRTSIGRNKLFLNEVPDFMYAVGDIHGCFDNYRRLEEKILEDARRESGTKAIVTLGDYVDRGPESAALLDYFTGNRTDALMRYHLAGNHEDVMLDFLERPSTSHEWLRFGGEETLSSYGIYKLPSRGRDISNVLRAHIPDEHVDFLKGLPSLLAFPDLCFVHAGIDDELPLKEQKDSTLLWMRHSAGKVARDGGVLVVHGHTPVDQVEIFPKRVNVDTGAYGSGRLSAVKITKSGEVSTVFCG